LTLVNNCDWRSGARFTVDILHRSLILASQVNFDSSVSLLAATVRAAKRPEKKKY